MRTLNDLLEEAAAQAGPRLALATLDETLTYSQLDARVRAAAAALAERGVKKGDCVAIIHRNSPVFVISYFALLRLGAVAVPINYMVSKAEELAFMFNDCKAVGVVTQMEFLKGVRGAAALASSVKTLWVSDPDAAGLPAGEESFADLLAAQPQTGKALSAGEDDTVAVLYTSGTTGYPKGVMLTHRNLITNCDSSIRQLHLTSRDSAVCILPMFHTLAWTANVLLFLKLKATIAIATSIAPARPWLKLMARHRVSLFCAVPQIYAVMAKQATGFSRLVLRYWFFRKVRFAISGAAPLSPSTLEAFENALGIRILEGYGLTETSPIISVNTPDKRKVGSVGVPIRGVKVKIIGEDGKTLPVGAEGEICARGDNIMKGYLNQPEATREAFTPDGWLKTGDVGVLDNEGFLYIRDRKKDMIIIKGLKVFSAQVEATLLEHPDVEEAAIIGIPDEHGDETIKAFVVLRPGAAVEKSELMRYCREKFDPYKRPRDIEIVDALPKNALQKVLKRELRQRELDRRAGRVS